MDAKKYWNEWYSGRAPNLVPSPFVDEIKHRLRKGKTLEVGMGDGATAVMLGLQGFQVHGVDISDVATERAQRLAKASGVELTVSTTDLDLFLFGLMEYDSVVMTNFRPPLKRYYYEIIRTLKQGGTLAVDSLMIDEMPEPIGPEEAYRHYYFQANELLDALKGLRILYYHEQLLEGKHRVQCLAMKPVDRDAVKYGGAFDMHSKDAQGSSSKHLDLVEKLFKK